MGMGMVVIGMFRRWIWRNEPEEAAGIDVHLLIIVLQDIMLLETIPLGRTGHHWDPYITPRVWKERPRKRFCVDQMLGR
jgi:hypothetical protein